MTAKAIEYPWVDNVDPGETQAFCWAIKGPGETRQMVKCYYVWWGGRGGGIADYSSHSTVINDMAGSVEDKMNTGASIMS